MALVAAAATSADGGVGTAELITGVVALSGLVYLAWTVDPAWPLSAGVVASVFSGNWALLGLPNLDRLLILLGLATVVLQARRDPLAPRFEMRTAHWALVAASVWVVLSALWAGTLSDSGSTFAMLDRYGLVPFALFAVAPIAFYKVRQRMILLGGLVALGGYLGLTALFEGLGIDGLVYPSYINDPSVGIHAERARGPFVEASAMGVSLIMCGAAAGVALALWRDRLLRVAAGAVLALCALGVVLTLTRAIWLGAALAVIITLGAVRELRRYLIPAIAVGAVAVVALLLAVPGLLGSVEERSSDQRPIWDRQNINAAALEMVEQRPLVGFGWGSFPEASQDFLRQADDIPLTGIGTQVHNVYLLYLAELGIIGLGLWLIAAILTVAAALYVRGPPEARVWQIGLIAVTVGWVVAASFAPLAQAFPNSVPFLWAGVVIAAAGGFDVPWWRRRSA